VPLVIVRGLAVTYGEHRALASVDLDLDGGTLVAFLGTSGAGKSTLLHAVTGLCRPTAGTVDVDGIRVTDLDTDGRRDFLRTRVAAVVCAEPGPAMLAGDPAIVVADDLTFSRPQAERTALAELLLSLRAPWRVVMAATHDGELAAVADVRYDVREGRVRRR